jgi:hypothetical protein
MQNHREDGYKIRNDGTDYDSGEGSPMLSMLRVNIIMSITTIANRLVYLQHAQLEHKISVKKTTKTDWLY